MTFLSTLFILYWLPTIIAIVRQAHSALGVFFVNFIFGLTGIGWIFALIWALAADNRTHEVIVRVDRGDYGPRP
ncbi:MAG TPA: superinfection immunity protein [Rhizomicrobium sp.]|nr:superinfection immunity protein [Rhizomicrobium sp.]